MKKWIGHIAVGLAAGLLWSCSQQPVDPQPTEGTPIEFSSDLFETATKASTLPVPFSDFRLYGVKKVSSELQAVFDDYGFVRASGDANWEYASHRQSVYPLQSRQYWDYTAKEYRFIAGAPYEKASFTPLFGKMTLSDLDMGYEVLSGSTSTLASSDAYYSPYYSLPNQVLPVDFGKTVSMTFRFALCKVNILFRFKYEQFVDMVIKNITFAPATTDADAKYATHGKLDVFYEFEHTPNVTTQLADYSSFLTTDPLSFSDTVIAQPCTTEVAVSECYWMLPSYESYSQAWKVQMTVTPDVAGLGERVFHATVPADKMFWEPGLSYTYLFELTDDGVEFIERVQTAIRSWSILTPLPHDFYNW